EQQLSVIEEVKIPKKIKNENFTPIPEKPEGMTVRNNKDLTPIPINKVKKKPEITTAVIEETMDIPIITEKRKITPIVSEITSTPPEVVEKTEDKIIKPFSVDPPKIRSMN
ncbi:MAG: hypothetical protein KGD73_13755, partial [Candidatus Lokiarchaeota archaeon]|nr:hypothetical protein [Candidatus Lokiarchaeota archaeon]